MVLGGIKHNSRARSAPTRGGRASKGSKGTNPAQIPSKPQVDQTLAEPSTQTSAPPGIPTSKGGAHVAEPVAVAGGVSEAVGGTKRGRGRPRKVGGAATQPAPASTADEAALAGGAPPPPAVDEGDDEGEEQGGRPAKRAARGGRRAAAGAGAEAEAGAVLEGEGGGEGGGQRQGRSRSRRVVAQAQGLAGEEGTDEPGLAAPPAPRVSAPKGGSSSKGGASRDMERELWGQVSTWTHS